MRRTFGFIGALALIGGISIGAAADDVVANTRSELSIDPGVAFTTGHTADYSNNSVSLSASELYRIHDVVLVGPEIGYIFSSKLEGTYSPGANFTSDVHNRVFHLTPEIKIGPTIQAMNATLNPYVMGGGGYYWTHQSAGTLQFLSGPLANQSVAVDSSNTHSGGFNFGGGLLVHFPQNIALGGEIRYHRLMHKNADDDTYVIPALNVTFKF